MDPTIEDIAGMYSSIDVPPPLATADPFLLLLHSPQLSRPEAHFKNPYRRDVQGEAGSRLRDAPANFY